MDPSERIELADLNFAEANREMSRRAGGVSYDEDGLCFWVGGHTLPVLCNGVVRTGMGPALPADEVLERARTFFTGHGRGYTVVLRAHADEDLAAAAKASDLSEWDGSPVMVLETRLADAVAPAGIRMDRVESDADAAAYADVMGAAYATYGMPVDVAPAILNLDVLRAPHIVSFLARLEDGTPAAGAMVILTNGVAGIYWVGTSTDARNRGLGELVTRAAGNVGFDLGARLVTLQASKMGEPIYRKMGYVTVTDYPAFVRF